MKEFRGSALNEHLLEVDGKLIGFGELIILLSEPGYHVDASGDMIRSRSVEQVRFGASADAMRKFSENLKTYADCLDKLAGKYVAETPEATP